MLEAIRGNAAVSPLKERRQEDRQTQDTVCLSSCHLVNVGLAAGERGGESPGVRLGGKGWQCRVTSGKRSTLLQWGCVNCKLCTFCSSPQISAGSVWHGIYLRQKCEMNSFKN